MKVTNSQSQFLIGHPPAVKQNVLRILASLCVILLIFGTHSIAFAMEPDVDGDGIPDWMEKGCTDATETDCPVLPPDTDGDGTPDFQDLDDDGDTIPTQDELADTDGDGEPDSFLDTDGDGIPDHKDTDDDGDGVLTFEEGTIDTDGDGLPNYQDQDDDGDGIPTVDEVIDNDGDGLADTIPNTDGDGLPDYLDPDDNDGPLGDLDGDGLTNEQEELIGSDKTSSDTDGDGVSDGVEVGDPDSPRDSDGDGMLDIFDTDDDDDGIPTADEFNPGPAGNVVIVPSYCGETRFKFYFLDDPDADGLPNYLDNDSDGDAIPDKDEGSGDIDGDGVSDLYDRNDDDGPLGDLDGDGLSNSQEETIGTDPCNPDSDGDGLSDGFEWSRGHDTDHDGVIDPLDTDDDGDGIDTSIEGGRDTDHDGIPDYLDLDSDGTGASDSKEGLDDGDGDGIPAFRDPDDGPRPLVCPFYGESNVDTDGDGRPDSIDDDADGDGKLDVDEGDGDNDCDGIPNYRDPRDWDGPCAGGDSDNDGIPNLFDYDEKDGPCAGDDAPNDSYYPIQNIDFGSIPGIVDQVETGRQITFQEVRGTATLVCDEANCPPGIDGAQVQIQKDMQILIDVTSAGVVGRSRGGMQVNLANGATRQVSFSGDLLGQSLCIGRYPTPCRFIVVRFNEVGDLLNLRDDIVGAMDLTLIGIIELGMVDTALQVQLRSLTGQGILKIAASEVAE